ncbi:MAG TPA: four helix bundle protein [Roseiflexaceae bacterium]|nr:four helix bundle protein [Roseiflexaceae bacterium]
MKYQDWEDDVPDSIKQDALWKVSAYRHGLLLSDLAWSDVTKLVGDRRTTALADQLYRAVGSISANIAEGYSRQSGRDFARFCEYALGSARESREWYYKARHILGEAVFEHRLQLVSEIIRLLLTMIPQQRRRNMKEQEEYYNTTIGQNDGQDIPS